MSAVNEIWLGAVFVVSYNSAAQFFCTNSVVDFLTEIHLL